MAVNIQPQSWHLGGRRLPWRQEDHAQGTAHTQHLKQLGRSSHKWGIFSLRTLILKKKMSSVEQDLGFLLTSPKVQSLTTTKKEKLRVPILFLLDNVFQKRDSEEMVGNIPCVEQQASIRAPLLSCCQRNLTVLYHLVDSVHSANHSNWLCRVCFLYHLPIKERQKQRKN